MSAWLAYRCVVTIFCVTVFFTGLPEYLFASGRAPFPPLYWLIALAVLALPLLFTPFTLSRVSESRLMLWAVFYATFTILAFMLSSQSAVAWAEVRMRLLAVLFLGVMVLILADPRVVRPARVTILCCVFFAAALNVVDVVRPLTFSPIVGRAAGLYLNPNMSAIGLVLGMIMSIELVPQRLRAWFVSFVGGGVLLTVSRGGAVAWVIATALIVATGGVRMMSVVRVVAGSALVVFGVLFLAGWWDAAVSAASLVWSDAWGRLRVGTELTDPSAEVRLGAASLSWEMFVDRPWFGWGVGATTEWDWSESTHNIYLRHLAEYGVTGIIIIPTLVAVLLWRRMGERPRAAVWLTGVALVWGIFSHNLLDERHFLICAALVAALGRDGRNRDDASPQPGLLATVRT